MADGITGDHIKPCTDGLGDFPILRIDNLRKTFDRWSYEAADFSSGLVMPG